MFGRLEVDGRAAKVNQPVLRYRANVQQRSPAPIGGQSTHEFVVSATDGLRGARRTTSYTKDRDRATAESDETRDIGKRDPEQAADLVDCYGVRLEAMVNTKGGSMRSSEPTSWVWLQH